jgi:hypothetical protein
LLDWSFVAVKNNRSFFVAVAAGVAIATVMLAPVLADEPFGVITNIDLDGNKLNLLLPTGKELEIQTTPDTEVVTSKKVKLTLKDIAEGVAKAKEAGRKGTFARVTHEKNVATKIRVGPPTTKQAK